MTIAHFNLKYVVLIFFLSSESAGRRRGEHNTELCLDAFVIFLPWLETGENYFFVFYGITMIFALKFYCLLYTLYNVMK